MRQETAALRDFNSPMTALGHERQMRSVRGNGACPLRPEKRTNGQTSRYVRFVPKAAVSNRSKTSPLSNHLVGAGEQCRRI
jgi:hypothetical protein